MTTVYPSDHPLRSAQRKVVRANVHIRALNTAAKRAASRPKVTMRRDGEIHLKSSIPGVIVEGASFEKVSIDPAVSQNWGAIAGDIFTNLRAALDHIAWALAQENVRRGVPLAPKDERDVYFPLRWTRLTKKQQPFIGGLNWNDVRFFPSEAHPKIEKLQPYNRTNRPELKLLWALKELVDADKHRIATPVFSAVGIRLSEDEQFIRTSLDQPYEMSFLVTDSARHKLKPEVTFEIAFHVPAIFPDHRVTLSHLRQVHDLIRDEVIPSFAGFFL